jgi:hypothetical protein
MFGKFFEIKGNRCLNISSYSHPEIWEFQGVTGAQLTETLRPQGLCQNVWQLINCSNEL